MDVAGSSNQLSKLLVLAMGDQADERVDRETHGNALTQCLRGNERVEWLEGGDRRPLVEAVVVVVGVEVVIVVGIGVGGDVVPVAVPFRHVGQVDVSAVADGRRRRHRRDKNLKKQMHI